MTPESKRLARVALLSLLAIEALALYGLLQRESVPATVLGRYSREYAVILAAFVGLALATLFLAVRPSARLTALVAGVARWLRKRWWLFAPLVYAGIEAWYALIGMARRVFFPALARRPAMTAVLLLFIWAALVLLFAGRTKAERKTTAVNLAVGLVSLMVAFWVFSLLVTRGLNFSDFRDKHHMWGGFLRYDYQLGYRGKPNLRDYEPPFCPAESEGTTYFTDETGFRNLPGAEDAPLVVIGDSFVFGYCLPYEDMWTTKLGEALNTEVANYAIPGTSLWYYNKYADVLVRPGDHRVLIYGLTDNDLIDEPDYDRSLYDRLATNGILYHMSHLNFTVASFLTKSPLTQIREGVTSLAGEPQEQYGWVELDNGVVLRDAMGYSQYLGPDSMVGERLETAMTQTDEMGVELVVVMIPSKNSIFRRDYLEAFPGIEDLPEVENQTYDALCAWLMDQGRLCYDLTDDMRRLAEEGQALSFSTDGHMSALGSQVAADLTADFLRENLPPDVLASLSESD